jgi:hypothetical protein
MEQLLPREFRARRQRVRDRGLATDQIAAHRDQGPAALRPVKRHQVRSSAAPVESGNDDLLDSERIQEVDSIGGDRRRLGVARRVRREKRFG